MVQIKRVYLVMSSYGDVTVPLEALCVPPKSFPGWVLTNCVNVEQLILGERRYKTVEDAIDDKLMTVSLDGQEVKVRDRRYYLLTVPLVDNSEFIAASLASSRVDRLGNVYYAGVARDCNGRCLVRLEPTFGSLKDGSAKQVMEREIRKVSDLSIIWTTFGELSKREFNKWVNENVRQGQ